MTRQEILAATSTIRAQLAGELPPDVTKKTASTIENAIVSAYEAGRCDGIEYALHGSLDVPPYEGSKRV